MHRRKWCDFASETCAASEACGVLWFTTTATARERAFMCHSCASGRTYKRPKPAPARSVYRSVTSGRPERLTHTAPASRQQVPHYAGLSHNAQIAGTRILPAKKNCAIRASNGCPCCGLRGAVGMRVTLDVKSLAHVRHSFRDIWRSHPRQRDDKNRPTAHQRTRTKQTPSLSSFLVG